MLKTVMTSTCISVQGEFVRRFEDGRVMVRVGSSYHVGLPVQRVNRGLSAPQVVPGSEQPAPEKLLVS